MQRANSVTFAILFLVSLAAMASDGSGFRGDVFAYGEAHCRNVETTTSLVRDFPGRIKHRDLEYLRNGTTIPVVEFDNTGTTAVSGLALVVDYLDSAGEVLARIAMRASATRSLAVPFPSQELQEWHGAVKPGTSELLVPTVMGRTLSDCPTRATVTFAQIVYIDGRVVTLHATGWTVDALPAVIPEVPSSLSREVPTLPFAVEAKVAITERGNVRDVTSDGQEHPTPVSDWVRSLLAKWKFYPAVVDGHPKASVLRCIVAAYPDNSSDIPIPVRGEQCLIRLVLGEAESGARKITVFYGEARENTEFIASTLRSEHDSDAK